MSDNNEVTVAIVQCPLGDPSTNVDRVCAHIESAAQAGAQIVLTPELFDGPYFPQEEEERYFAWAQPIENHPTLKRIQALARAHQVVLPYSFFEAKGQCYYNSLALVDADGQVLGVYRKSHIPDGPGYEEKFYFRPGDTGFRVWSTRYGVLGVGICWDQWFPECARVMALMGAEFLLYPTAIGSEPVSEEDTLLPWQRAMIGHAVCNAMPVAAANRLGIEENQEFYGGSFIANERGDKVAEFGPKEEGIQLYTFDRAKLRARRAEWGFFRDRRPELYSLLLTADGVSR